MIFGDFPSASPPVFSTGTCPQKSVLLFSFARHGKLGKLMLPLDHWGYPIDKPKEPTAINRLRAQSSSCASPEVVRIVICRPCVTKREGIHQDG